MPEKDQFFDFLISQIQEKEQKIILELIIKYQGKTDTREFIRECLSKLKYIHNNDQN